MTDTQFPISTPTQSDTCPLTHWPAEESDRYMAALSLLTDAESISLKSGHRLQKHAERGWYAYAYVEGQNQMDCLLTDACGQVRFFADVFDAYAACCEAVRDARAGVPKAPAMPVRWEIFYRLMTECIVGTPDGTPLGNIRAEIKRRFVDAGHTEAEYDACVACLQGRNAEDKHDALR